MEQKYESDLSRREKLEQQWETLHSLKGKKKLEYIWSYYKFVFVILIAVILLIDIVSVMIRGARENTVLSVVVVDAVQTEEDAAGNLEEELLELLGAEGKYDVVEIDLSVRSLRTEEYIAKLRVALSSVGEADLVICNEDVYKEYSAQGAFADIETLLKDAPENLADKQTDGQIDLSKCTDSFLSKYVDYEPAYLCVMEHSERKDSAAKVIESVVE